MIIIKNMKSLSGIIEDLTIESEDDYSYDAEGKLIGLPGLIDAHVHFRTPGAEEKENWISGAKAAIQGGVTTVFDMPNNTPSCVDPQSFSIKKSLIDQQLAACGIPLRYHLFLGADKDHIETMGQIRNKIIGIKVYMGSSTGGLVMNDPKDLDRTFELAAQHNLMVAVHAEDEGVLKERQAAYAHSSDPADHSKIRDRQAAIKATEQAISLAEKYNSQVYILHLSTKEELDLVRQAKKQQILVFAEVSPHHLFLNEDDYEKWDTKVQVNPPLRTEKDQEALWEGIHDKTVDSIGSDHAPHILSEKNQPFGKAPSGIPGVETTLPLLLNAVNQGKISLEHIVNLMRINPEQIYNLPHNNDFVLVDMEMEKILSDKMLKTKCGWSPYSGRTLKGWPIYTIVQNKIFKVN
jgi:dihydroorotase